MHGYVNTRYIFSNTMTLQLQYTKFNYDKYNYHHLSCHKYTGGQGRCGYKSRHMCCCWSYCRVYNDSSQQDRYRTAYLPQLFREQKQPIYVAVMCIHIIGESRQCVKEWVSKWLKVWVREYRRLWNNVWPTGHIFYIGFCITRYAWPLLLGDIPQPQYHPW